MTSVVERILYRELCHLSAGCGDPADHQATSRWVDYHRYAWEEGGERPRAWPCPEQLPVDSRNLLLSTVLLTMYTGGPPMSRAGQVRSDDGTGDWKG